MIFAGSVFKSRPYRGLVILSFCICWLLVWSLLPASAADHVPIISGCEDNYPPFCILNQEGEADGFSVELLKAVAAAMGREVYFRTGSWSDLKMMLEKGEVEALPLVGRTPERENLFDFSVPYLTMHGAIVYREGTDGIHSLQDLVGRRVAVMKGDNSEEFLKRTGLNLNIKETVSFEEALKEVDEGTQDAVVMQRLVALRLIKENGFKNLVIEKEPVAGYVQDFCFAVQEGNKDLLASLNEGLALVIADGTFTRLYSRWFAILEVTDNRRMVVGGDSYYPPYEFLDEKGQPAGYNVDLTRAIAREAGLDVEIRLAPWATTVERLRNGEIDAVHGMFFSPERQQFFNFSSPHSMIKHVAVIRKGDGEPPADISALSGKRIVVMQGDIMHEFVVKNNLLASLALVQSQEEALRELAEGRHDCALVARLPAMYWVEKHNWKNLVIGQNPILSSEYCYAVKFSQKALLSQIGESLKILDETGEYRRIHEKWLGVFGESAFDFTPVIRMFWLLLILFTLTLVVAIIWSWSLRQQVSKRTSELKASEAQLRALVEGAPDAIFIQTGSQFRYLNSAACRLFGAKSIDQLLEKPVVERIRNAETRTVGELHAREEEFIRLDGSLVPVEVSAVPFTHEGQPGTLVFVRDITTRKKSEEENQRQVDELHRWQTVTLGREERIQELKKQINDLCRRLGEPARFPSQEL